MFTVLKKRILSGADPGFFLGGVAPLRNGVTNAPINVKPLGGGGRAKVGDLTVIIVP